MAEWKLFYDSRVFEEARRRAHSRREQRRAEEISRGFTDEFNAASKRVALHNLPREKGMLVSDDSFVKALIPLA